ncbi:DUF6603 domain-containing protein [Streptomyces sp. NPDC048506]|uniref:DUF6603 domain-containing protein n=1 Tax=Streptomyces sp. NPDC048506 TaxID=3155028 RepID=UPI003434F8B1
MPAQMFAIDAVDQLFATYGSGSALEVSEAVCDLPRLEVRGRALLAGQTRATCLRFLTDPAGEVIVGVEAVAEGFDWLITEPPEAAGDFTFLRDAGFTEPVVLFSAGHEVTGVVCADGSAYTVGPGAAFTVPTGDGPATAYVTVLAPGVLQRYQLSARLPNAVPLASMEALAQLPLLTGLPVADLDIPPQIENVLSAVRLKEVSAAYATDTSTIDQAGIVLTAAPGTRWEIIEGYLVLESFHDLFLAAVREDGSWQLAASMGATLTVAGRYELRADLTLPQQRLTATLTRPDLIGDLIADHLDSTGLDLSSVTVDYLRVECDIPARSYCLTLALATDTPWTPIAGVALEGLELRLRGQGSSSITDATLTGRFTIGQSTVVLEGVRSGTVWRVAGSAFDVDVESFVTWFQDVFRVDFPASLRGLELSQFQVELDTSGKARINCVALTPLAGLDAVLQLTITVDRAISLTQVTGWLQLAVPPVADDQRVLDFKVDYTSGAGDRALTATWEGTPGISAQELADALGLTLPELPAVLTPTLDAAGLHYDVADRMLVITAHGGSWGWMVASQATEPTGRRYTMAVRGAVTARASQLPLVGEAIPADCDLLLTGIQFGYTPQAWTENEVERLNEVLNLLDTASPPRLPRLLKGPLTPGILAWAQVSAGGEELSPLVLRLDAKPGSALAAGTSAPVDAIVLGRELKRSQEASQDIGRVFGPVRIHRVSLGYRKGVLFIAFDATFSVGPADLNLIGLGLGIDKDFTVSPVLQGAGLRIDRPPLKVTGALVVREDDEFEIYIAGMVTVEAGFFAMQAAGSYARSVDGWSSVFLFGEIAAAGGAALFAAPPFTVTAVSAGFGVNSTLRIPAIEELGDFPLVANLAGGPSGDSPQDALEALAAWVRPAEGRYWGAAGLEFTLFKFIATRALAVAEFGDDLKLALLGRTSVTFPRDTKPGKKVHARLDIDLKLAYQQSQGLLSLDVAVGAGSFVFDPACRLTGGIAIYIWTAGIHAGDFVISAGGYHPMLEENLPTQYPHYPRPARLGFTWSPDSKIMVKAEGYTALTPHALMFGGRLAATYTSGLLSAWFTAYLDVLVQWRPFYLDARLGIGIGVAFTIKIWFVKVRVSIEVGIDLALRTPPFGGRVTVKVWFVSFSFDIGSKPQELDAAQWPEVHEQLPEPLSITPVAGLLADIDADELAARRADGDPVLVAAAGLVFTVETVIPATAIHLNQDTDYATAPDGRISIRPMRKDASISSEFVVTVAKVGDADYVISEDDWTVGVIKRGAPAALWGRPLAKPDNALDEGQEALLPDQLAGLRFEVKLPETAGEIGPVTSAALAVTQVTPNGHTPLRNGGKQGPVPLSTPGSIETIASTVNTSTAARRAGAYRALHRLGLAPGAFGASLPRYADKAPDYLVSSPLTTTTR